MKYFVLVLPLILLFSCGPSDDPKAVKLMNEGMQFIESHNFNSALVRFREASTLDLSDESKAKNYRNLAVVFLYLDQADSAKRYSKLGFECLDAHSYYHFINMAEYELLSKQTDKAIQTFEEAKKINPKEMEVYNNLSLIYAGNYGESFVNLDKALLNAKKAFDLKPNAVNQEQLASVYFQFENYAKAIQLFHDLSVRFPAVKLYQFSKVRVYTFRATKKMAWI